MQSIRQGGHYRLRREHVFHQVLVRNLLPDQSNRFLPIQCLSHSPKPLTCRSTSTVSCPAFSTSDSLTSLWVTKRTTFSPSDTAKTPRFFNSSTTREAVTPNPSKFTTMMFVSTGCGIDTPSTSPKYPASRAAFLWSSANLSMLFSAHRDTRPPAPLPAASPHRTSCERNATCQQRHGYLRQQIQRARPDPWRSRPSPCRHAGHIGQDPRR